MVNMGVLVGVGIASVAFVGAVFYFYGMLFNKYLVKKSPAKTSPATQKEAIVPEDA